MTLNLDSELGSILDVDVDILRGYDFQIAQDFEDIIQFRNIKMNLEIQKWEGKNTC